MERIQKIISASGLCSRRTAEKYIEEGRVSINGRTAVIGESADASKDLICVDGTPIPSMQTRSYIMLNKPRGYVTSLSDEKGRKCVADLVKDLDIRVYPIGRLDMYSEGLLLMTDDGEFANKLMHPKYSVEKEYHAWIAGKCSDESISVLTSPLIIDGYKIAPAKVSVIEENDDYTVLSISIHEGRNRQIRKMCEIAGLKLTRLMRISEGPVKLGDLAPGKWRHLTSEEIRLLTTE